MTETQPSCTITLGGVKLDLAFRLKNQIALSRITGRPGISFVLERFRQVETEDEYTAGLQCSDPAFLVPIIMAGLAHHQEYSKLTTEELETKIAGLFDKEVSSSKKTFMEISATTFTAISGALMASITPPGAAPAADEGGKKKPARPRRQSKRA